MDSGATDHITGDLERLHVRDTYHGNNRVHVGNGAGMAISHLGHSSISTTAKDLVLKNVMYAPHISKDLLSIHKLALDNGVFIEFILIIFLLRIWCRRERCFAAGVEEVSTQSSLQK
jgi:histone deacetylase 1/2